MKPQLWKRIVSHFYELHLESMPSVINPHLYVSLVQGKYQLCTENAIYSHGLLYKNFADAFLQLNLDALGGQKVLILGFGLGSIPEILEKIHHKKYTYTGVEIDENVLLLAQKYVLDDLHSSLELVCADATLFVAQCTDEFDMICVDVFLDDKIPKRFQQGEFLTKVKSCLKPRGLLLYNRLTWTEADKTKASDFYNNTFLSVFKNGHNIEVKGNWVLINDKSFLK